MKLKSSARMTRNLLAVAVTLVLCNAAVAAQPRPAAKQFDIRDQLLSSALNEFARQSNQQILFSTNAVQTKRTQGVKGDLSPEAALQLLLKGTGLTYRFTADNTILVENPRARDTADASAPEGLIRLAQTASVQAPGSGVGANQPAAGTTTDEGEMVVTGSRVRGQAAPVGAQVIVIDRKDMERQGLFSAEDVIRSLPFNLSEVNSASTTAVTGDSVPVSAAIGQSTANLRGLGSNATLILVNGRRVAGSPSFNGDGTVNLNTIPFAAIERVEVMLDGASAIYGSDALGGVINFILRKDWHGAESSLRTDVAANEGDTREFSQVLGTNWSSGGVTATFSYRESEPASARKAGFVTSDLRAWGGSDYRTLPAVGRPAANPGNVSDGARNANGTFIAGARLGSLPAGWSGPFTLANLSLANVAPYDPAASGEDVMAVAESTNRGLTISFNQSITRSISVFTDVIYAKSKNMRLNPASTLSVIVPTTNPFNTLGREVQVNYLLTPEDGVPGSRNFSDSIRWNGNVGIRAQLPANWRMELVGDYSTEEREFFSSSFASTSTAFQDALRGQTTAGVVVPAFNPFTGEHAAGVDLASMVAPTVTSSSPVEQQGAELSADGALFSLPGGKVNIATGAQWRNELIDFSNSSFDLSLNGLNRTDARPILERTAKVLFAETVVPVVGRSNGRAGIRELLVTVAARWEEYDVQNPVAGRADTQFSAVSPRVGISWRPIDTLRVRGSWNNSFRAPSLTELGRPMERGASQRTILDPFHPSGTPQNVAVWQWSGGNINLEAETTNSVSLGFDWLPAFLPGLKISPTYNRMDWEDRISVGSIFTDQSLMAPDTRFPFLATRDVNGNLTDIRIIPINLTSSLHESLDLDVSHDLETRFGGLHLGATFARILRSERSNASQTAIISNVGTRSGPDDLVIRARLGWSRSNYGLTLICNHSSDYLNNSDLPVTHPAWRPTQVVSSYTTADITGYWEGPHQWVVNGGVRNFTDADFPFYDNMRANYDASRVDPRGRILYVQVKKSFSF